MGFGFGPLPNVIQVTSAAPTGTSSAGTLVMLGLAGSITPSVTGRVLFMVSGNFASGTTNDGGAAQISYGTGGAPSNGGGLTGTQVGNLATMTADLAGSDKMPFSTQFMVSTLTVGTVYWFDLAFEALTGGTFSITTVTMTAMEM